VNLRRGFYPIPQKAAREDLLGNVRFGWYTRRNFEKPGRSPPARAYSRAAFSDDRTRPRIRWPDAFNRRATVPPIKPLAPVKKMFMPVAPYMPQSGARPERLIIWLPGRVSAPISAISSDESSKSKIADRST
jgi:hypothetical protein